MKKVLLLLFIASYSFGQEIVYEKGNAHISEILPLSVSKEVAYGNAKKWIAKTFGDYKSVVQLEDDKTFSLIIKGISRIPYTGRTTYSTIYQKLHYTLSIDFKDEKYKYKFDDIKVDEIGSPVKLSPKPIIMNNLLADRYSERLDSLENVKIASLKKNTKKIHTLELENTRLSSVMYSNFAIIQVSTMQDLVKSLKDSINRVEDF